MSVIADVVPSVGGISDVLWYAIIIAVSSTLSPLVLSFSTNRHAHADRLEDWARQDAIAKKAADAAELLIASNRKMAAQAAEAASLLLDSDKKRETTAAITVQKLDVIHTLVNSNMTASMQSELIAVQAQLVLIREVMTLNSAAGREPSVETLAVEKAAETKVAELTAALADRLKVQATPAVAAEQAKAKAKGQE